MGRRALIIGIEDYANSDGSIEKKLDGTLDSALAFRAWLEKKWDDDQVPDADRQIIFCSEPAIAGGRPASSEGLTQAFIDLRNEGQNATEEFFFYFSGHGFSFVERAGVPRNDIMITSDFRSAEKSGGACMNLASAINWFRQHLGPGRQYYFVDACRNDIDAKRINPGNLVPPSDPQTSEEASTFLLQSTAPSATAAVDGRFAKALLDGLHGKSTAKIWDEEEDDAMLVRFDTLRVFVRGRMTPQVPWANVAGSEGETDGIIARFRPAPTLQCTVNITGGTKSPMGTIVAVGRRDRAPVSSPIAGASTLFVLKPDSYRISVSLDQGQLRESEKSLPIHDDEVLNFEIVTFGAPVAPAPGGTVDIIVREDRTVELTDKAAGKTRRYRGGRTTGVPPGSYAAIVLNEKTPSVLADDPLFEAGTATQIVGPTGTLAHKSIASRFDTRDGGIVFSGTLGPLGNTELSVWLAILGGGRVLAGAPHSDFSLIAALPLYDFTLKKPGSSLVYVLAGFEDGETFLQAAVSKEITEPTWRVASSVSEMPGLLEAVIDTAPGPTFVSVKVSDGPAATFASLSLPNRATLVTVTLDEGGLPVISQYILPIGGLIDHLDAQVTEKLRSRDPLQDLLLLTKATEAFRRRKDFRKTLPDHFLDDVLYAKWLDPLGAAMAAYELIRRGRTENLSVVMANLETYFPDLPDTAALALLAGLRGRGLGAVPLFQDGLRALAEGGPKLPLPAALLDYDSPWTLWRGVVK